MNKNTVYETERLLIRKAELKDIEDLYIIYNDENILQYNCINNITRDMIQAKINEPAKNERTFSLELKSVKKIIGEISVTKDKLRYEVNSLMLSWQLNSDYVGLGYMSEALRIVLKICFEQMKCEIVSVHIISENVRSNALAAKMGFVLEGTLRYAIKGYKDIIYDNNLYSITKDEYLRRYRR